MSYQGRWLTNSDTKSELQHKLGECIWWVIVLAERMDIDISEALETFLPKTERNLND